MKKILILSALLACGPACFSQQTEKFPLGDYEELTDTKPHDGVDVWNKMTAPVRFCWGTTDVRYKKEDNEVMSENLWKIMKKQGF